MAISKLIGLKRKAKRDGWKFPFSPTDEKALLDGCYYDEMAAHDPIIWIESFCRLAVGEKAGQLVSLHDWQKNKILLPLFGWKDKNGLRRYRSTYITIAKKNWKSTLASSLALYMLMMDNEPGAQIYLAASASDQTDNVFLPAAAMVDSSPALSKHLDISAHIHKIKFGRTSFIKGLSAKDDTSQGVDAHLVVIDELHVWRTETQVKFYSSLKWAGAARRQPIFFQITTRGDDEDSLCGQQDEYAKAIIAGDILDTRHLAVVFEASRDKPLTHVKNIKAANPVWDTREKIELFQSEYAAAKKQGAETLAQFERYRFNLWTKSAVQFFQPAAWKAAQRQNILPDERVKAWGGLDLSSKEDITSYAICWKIDQKYRLLTRHFAPELKVNELAEQGKDNYLRWQKRGDLIVSDGSIVNHEDVKRQLQEDILLFNLELMNFDRWNADQLAQWIQDHLDIVVAQFGQGYKSFTYPTKEFRNALLAGAIEIEENQVLTWMSENTWIVEDGAECIKPVKKVGKTKYKIDGIVASIMAFDGAVRDQGNMFAMSNQEVATVNL